MEAGSGADHWGRCLAAMGHDVRLMPPQYVRPYVKGNKHDASDAEACCEAVQRPGMHFVPVKSETQQETLMLHRVRDHFIRCRTGAINALRGHLAEFGLVSASQRAGLNQLLLLVEDSGSAIPSEVTELLGMITSEIRAYGRSIAELDKRLCMLRLKRPTCWQYVAGSSHQHYEGRGDLSRGNRNVDIAPRTDKAAVAFRISAQGFTR
jgi:transposase